jgi:tetratricopeptide (TPR) repeat protein
VTKWESSLSLFEHAVYVTKNNAMALENAAYAYSRIGDIDTAIQRMEESLRVFPENAICWNELGAAHMKKGNYQLAARDFRNALLIDARDSVARCNFATALTAMGELSGAENELRQLIAAHPTMAQAHFRYGLLLEKLARKEEALARLREANRLEPANPLIGEALARFAVKNNE